MILLTKFEPLFEAGAATIKNSNRGGGGNGRRQVGAPGDLLDIFFSVFATHTPVGGQLAGGPDSAPLRARQLGTSVLKSRAKTKGPPKPTEPLLRNWHHEKYHLLSIKMRERVGPKSPLISFK